LFLCFKDHAQIEQRRTGILYIWGFEKDERARTAAVGIKISFLKSTPKRK